MIPKDIVLNIEIVTGIIVALSALIVTAIKQFFKIRKLIAQLRIQKAKNQFQIISSPYMSIAEQTPQVIYDSLKYKPLQIVEKTYTIDSNEGKALIVAQATLEQMKMKKSKHLTYLKIKNRHDALPYVSQHYQGIVKPVLFSKNK